MIVNRQHSVPPESMGHLTWLSGWVLHKTVRFRSNYLDPPLVVISIHKASHLDPAPCSTIKEYCIDGHNYLMTTKLNGDDSPILVISIPVSYYGDWWCSIKLKEELSRHEGSDDIFGCWQGFVWRRPQKHSLFWLVSPGSPVSTARREYDEQELPTGSWSDF